MQKLKDLFLELTPDYQGDKWGYMASTAFDVEAAIWNRGGTNNPSYRPSPLGVDIEDEYKKEILEALDITTLERLSRYCSRLWNLLETKGLSY